MAQPLAFVVDRVPGQQPSVLALALASRGLRVGIVAFIKAHLGAVVKAVAAFGDDVVAGS